MTYALLILAGALLCNCIPHLVAGLQGHPFPTPFAKPPGVGRSPAIVNFAWGSANLLPALILALWRYPYGASIPGFLAVAIGFIAVGSYLSMHFGKSQIDQCVHASRPEGDAARSIPTPPHP